MIQFSKTWGASLPHLAVAAMFVATGAQAQSVVDDMPINRSGAIYWSKNASSAYKLNQFTGSFYSEVVTATANIGPGGGPRTFNQYVKALTAVPVTFDADGKLNSGSLADELTWTGGEFEDGHMLGGTFTLSNLHWQLLADGHAEILATASGTGITTTDLVAFTTPASAVMIANWDGFTLTQLTLSDTAFSLWVQALGADDATGLTYMTLKAISPNIGSLRIGMVPESATWLQMGLGLVGLGALLRRRQQR